MEKADNVTPERPVRGTPIRLDHVERIDVVAGGIYVLIEFKNGIIVVLRDERYPVVERVPE